jgi:hypothetical protein
MRRFCIELRKKLEFVYNIDKFDKLYNNIERTDAKRNLNQTAKVVIQK